MGPQTSYAHNNEKHGKMNPFIFGMYLNQARLNAYITLCHISDLVGGGTVVENALCTARVLNRLDKFDDPIRSRKMFELIEHHFPMLKSIVNGLQKRRSGGANETSDTDVNTKATDYKRVLVALLTAIQEKRNQYCHAVSADTLSDKADVQELIRYLEDCFDASVNTVKTRLSLYEDDKEANNPHDEVLHLRRFKGKAKRNLFFMYPFRNADRSLTGKGLAFLTSLFLEKDDAFKFLSTCGLTGFKRTEEDRYRATPLCYTALRIRLPHPKIRSDDDRNGLLLDMLGDLRKCPRELFDVLSKERQESFRIKDDSGEGSDEADEILLMRYSDRFARMALRFCDENAVFEELRFQINLGKYYFKFYPKTGADGQTYDRQLDKTLKTFGRLREVKERVAAEWKSKGLVKAPDEIEEGHDQPYKTNSTPDYHIVNNQIGIVLSGDAGLPNIVSGEEKVVLGTPDAWLSIYHLPALVFHGLTHAKGFAATERLIRQYVTQQQKGIAEAATTGTVSEESRNKQFFPRALLEQKTRTQAAYAAHKLQDLIKDTEERQTRVKKTLERMADTSNKPGKKQFIELKAGKLADWLAKDMVKLQPSDPDKMGRDKTTALNYQVLQESLALFGAKKNSLSRIFKELGLTRGDNQHPFLHRLKDAVAYRSIVDFYRAYLAERLGYFLTLQKEGKLSQPFLRATRRRYAETFDVQTAASQLEEMPVNLPGDLVKADIERLVCGKIPSLNGQQTNTAYLIQKWFEETEGGSQPFYAYERTYPIVDKAIEYCKKRDNHRIRTILKQITPEKSYQELKALIEKSVPESGEFEPEHLRRNLLEGCKDYKENERILRRFTVEDRVAFMMAKQMFEQEYGVTVTNEISAESNREHPNNPEAKPPRPVLPFKLENICPENESPFRYPMPDSVTQAVFSFNNKERHEKEYVEHIDARYQHCAGYLRNDEKRELTYQITLTKVKLKDLGKHRKHFKDRRLSGLLIWKWAPNADGKTRITLADIEEEIKAYQQHRTAIAKRLRVFEEKAIKRYGLQPPGEAKYVPFELVSNTVKEKLPEYEAECDTIRCIRNAVNHNQFPAYRQDIENIKTREADGQTIICHTIAEKMLAVTDRYVDKLIQEMENGSEEVKYA